MQLAPWLKSTDTLGAINSGSSAGLAIRAAIERERAQRAEEAMAQDRAAQAEQSAAEKLKLDYDQLGLQSRFHDQDRQARVADSQLDNETRLKLGQAANALRLSDADALSKWRAIQLDEKDKDRVLRKELAEKRSAADMLKPQHVGKSVISIDRDGKVTKLYSENESEKAPTISGLALTDDPNGPKLSGVRANNPLLNDPRMAASLGTNSASLLGTNWQSKATAPKALDKATAKQFLDQSKGDKEKARQLAKEAGYSF